MAYPPTAQSAKTIVEAVHGCEVPSVNGAFNPNIADVLANAKLELELANQRMEKLQTKISDSENQIAEWTKQVESLRVSIQRAYVAQVGYEELLPVAAHKQKIAAQRVERLEHSLKKFERQVKLEDYLKELEGEEDGKEDFQKYWQEVGETVSIPRPTSAGLSEAEFDDLGVPAQPPLPTPEQHPILLGHAPEEDELDRIINGVYTPAPSSPRSLSDVPVLSPSPRHPIAIICEPSPSPQPEDAWERGRTPAATTDGGDNQVIDYLLSHSPAPSRYASSVDANQDMSDLDETSRSRFPTPNPIEDGTQSDYDAVGQLVDYEANHSAERASLELFDVPTEELEVPFVPAPSPVPIWVPETVYEPKVSAVKGKKGKKGKK